MRPRRITEIPKEVFKLPWAERFLAKLTQQKKPGQFMAKLPPLYDTYPKNSFRRVTRQGIAYDLDISDYMEWLVFYGIQVEPRDVLYRLVNNGDTVVDVGANIGEVTLTMSRLAGTSGSIHSFEPDPLLFAKISRNCALNSAHNIVLNNVALGDKNEELFLGAQVENNRGGTRVQRNLSAGQKVKVTTLDDYALHLELQRLNLVKIDVEGFEFRVLSGATNTIARFRPLLFIEVDDDNLRAQGDSAVVLVSFLLNHGYTHLINAENNEIITPNANFLQCHFDMVALPT